MASVINQTLCRSNDKQNITRIEMSNQINYWHNNANETRVLNHIRLHCKNREICIICNICMNFTTIRAIPIFYFFSTFYETILRHNHRGLPEDVGVRDEPWGIGKEGEN